MTYVSHPFAVIYHSQVEVVWSALALVLQVYGTQFRGAYGGIRVDSDIQQSAPVTFGETSVPRDEITRRMQAWRTEFEIGKWTVAI